MNENVTAELSRVVESTVRPLRASLSRKRRMRDEMLSHLGTIYEEEYRQSGDEQVALTQAKLRFGDPATISADLQKSLPRWQRVRYFLEKQRWEPGESVWHFVGKHLGFSAVVWGVFVLSLILRPLLRTSHPTETWLSIRIVLIMAAVFTSFSIAFLLTLTQFSLAIHGSAAQRSVRKAIVAGVAAMLLFPALIGLLYGGLHWVTGEITLPPLAYIGACFFAPFTLGVFVLAARRYAEEALYEEKWAGIELEC